MKKSLLFASVAAISAAAFLFVSCGGSSPTAAKDHVAITSPVAKQKVLAGDTLLVSWTQSVASPKISYNYNYGAGWQQFASDSVIPVDNYSAKAILPVTSYTDSFQIKVEDNSGTLDAGTSAPFSIKYIIITSQLTGQTFSVGQTVTITWKDFPDKFSSFNILLSTDNGKSGLGKGVINATSLLLSEKSYSWVIGSEPGSGAPFSYPSSQCILRVSNYNQDNKGLYDDSGTFSVQ